MQTFPNERIHDKISVIRGYTVRFNALPRWQGFVPQPGNSQLNEGLVKADGDRQEVEAEGEWQQLPHNFQASVDATLQHEF